MAQDLQLGNFEGAYDLIESVIPLAINHRPMMKRLYYSVEDQLNSATEAVYVIRDELKAVGEISQQLNGLSFLDLSTRANLSLQLTKRLLEVPLKIKPAPPFNDKDFPVTKVETESEE